MIALVPLHALWSAACDLLSSDVALPGVTTRWPTLLGTTAVVCGMALLLAIGGGLALAIVIRRTDLPGRGVLWLAALLGCCVPVYLSAALFFARIPVWRFSQSAWFCGVLYGLVGMPLGTVILAAALGTADREREEQALLDATPWSVLWRVTLPQLGWPLAATSAVLLLLVGTDFTLSDILAVRTFAEEVYTQYTLNISPAGPVLTAMPILALLSVLVLVVQLRAASRAEHSLWTLGAASRFLVKFGPAGIVCGSLLVLAAAVLLGWPLSALLQQVDSPAAFVDSAARVWPELAVSLVTSAAAASVIVVLALPLAAAARRGTRVRFVALAFIVLLLATPAPVSASSLIRLLNRPGWLGAIYDHPAILLVGDVVRFLPYAALLLIPAVQRVPAQLEQLARLDGCGWLGRQRHVWWPGVAREWPVVWLLVAVLCFGEVGATVLLYPPNWTPAAVRAFTLIHFGVYRDLAVLALLSAACLPLPWLLLVWTLRRQHVRRSD